MMMMMMTAKVMIMTYSMTMFTIIDDQDDNCDYITINLDNGYGNNFELDYLQDVDISKGVDRGGEYDNDDNIDDNGDGHIDLEGPLGSYKEYIR